MEPTRLTPPPRSSQHYLFVCSLEIISRCPFFFPPRLTNWAIFGGALRYKGRHSAPGNMLLPMDAPASNAALITWFLEWSFIIFVFCCIFVLNNKKSFNMQGPVQIMKQGIMRHTGHSFSLQHPHVSMLVSVLSSGRLIKGNETIVHAVASVARCRSMRPFSFPHSMRDGKVRNLPTAMQASVRSYWEAYLQQFLAVLAWGIDRWLVIVWPWRYGLGAMIFWLFKELLLGPILVLLLFLNFFASFWPPTYLVRLASATAEWVWWLEHESRIDCSFLD